MNDYDSLIDAFHEFFTQDPNDCVELGVDKHLDDLPDPTLAAYQDDVVAAQQLLSKFQAVPREELSFDQALDVELAQLALDFEIFSNTFTFNGKTEQAQMPTAAEDISKGIFLLFTNDPRQPSERLDNITARLEKVPQYLDELLGRLDTPVSRWVDMDLQGVRELPELFESISEWAKDENYADLGQLVSAKERAVAAINRYVIKISELATTPHFAIGELQARRLVQLRGIDESFEELLILARHFLSNKAKLIETLRVKLCTKYFLPPGTNAHQLHDFLNQRQALPIDEIMETYRTELNRVCLFVQNTNLFTIPKNQNMVLLKTPAFFEPQIPAGAMELPTPFRSGVRQSLIYLTITQDVINEHTRLKIPAMLVHEGIPGHHLQFASAFNNPSIVRKHIEANDHAEGWTTMLEDYMLDLGYMGERTDEARFLCALENSRLGARVGIDLYFMTGEKKYLDVGVAVDVSSEDPFVNAANLLKTVTGFSDARVQGELNWYSQERGYPLSYLVGNHNVWQLKHMLTATHRGKMSQVEIDRAFHKIYLESGCMPLKYLRRVFEEKGLL